MACFAWSLFLLFRLDSSTLVLVVCRWPLGELLPVTNRSLPAPSPVSNPRRPTQSPWSHVQGHTCHVRQAHAGASEYYSSLLHLSCLQLTYSFVVLFGTTSDVNICRQVTPLPSHNLQANQMENLENCQTPPNSKQTDWNANRRRKLANFSSIRWTSSCNENWGLAVWFAGLLSLNSSKSMTSDSKAIGKTISL